MQMKKQPVVLAAASSAAGPEPGPAVAPEPASVLVGVDLSECQGDLPQDHRRDQSDSRCSGSILLRKRR